MLGNPFDEQQWLLQKSTTRTILDVGAHIGQICMRYRTVFSTAHIYSFEPFPETYTQLKANLSDFANVTPIQLAVANEDGQREFYSNGASYTNSLFPAEQHAELWVEP